MLRLLEFVKFSSKRIRLSSIRREKEGNPLSPDFRGELAKVSNEPPEPCPSASMQKERKAEN